jgi:DNA repair and recombination protein RAD54B
VAETDFRSGACFAKPTAQYGAVAQPGMGSAGTRQPLAPIKANVGQPGQPGKRPVSSAAQDQPPRPLYDMDQPHIYLLNGSQWQDGKGKLESGRWAAPVLVDPWLGRHLRPHQVA